MKKLCYLGIAAIAAILLSSCGDEIAASKSEITKLLAEKMEEEGSNVVTSTLKVGCFETDSPKEMLLYKRLEAAGVVTCNIENYQWFDRVIDNVYHTVLVIDYYYEGTDELAYPYHRESTDFSPTITKYIRHNHYLLNVALTKKGQKMIAEEKAEKVDKDAIHCEFDQKKYPLDTTLFEVLVAELPEPALPEPTHQKVFVPNPRKNQPAPQVKYQPVPENKPVAKKRQYPYTECMDPATAAAYEKALAAVNPEEVTLVIAELEVDQVRNRVVTYQEDKYRVTEAEVIIEYVDVSDGGRLLGLRDQRDLYNGLKFTAKVKVENTRDRGEVDAQQDWRLVGVESAQAPSKPATFTEKPVKKVVSTFDGILYFRTNPNSDAKILYKLHNGDVVEVIQELESGWCLVDVRGQRGYAHGNYLKPILEDSNQ